MGYLNCEAYLGAIPAPLSTVLAAQVHRRRTRAFWGLNRDRLMCILTPSRLPFPDAFLMRLLRVWGKNSLSLRGASHSLIIKVAGTLPPPDVSLGAGGVSVAL